MDFIRYVSDEKVMVVKPKDLTSLAEAMETLKLERLVSEASAKRGKELEQNLGIDTKDILSDLGSKPCGPDEYIRFLHVICGFQKWILKTPRETMTMV